MPRSSDCRSPVPTLIAFSYFSKKVEVMSVEMETLVGGIDQQVLLRTRLRKTCSSAGRDLGARRRRWRTRRLR